MVPEGTPASARTAVCTADDATLCARPDAVAEPTVSDHVPPVRPAGNVMTFAVGNGVPVGLAMSSGLPLPFKVKVASCNAFGSPAALSFQMTGPEPLYASGEIVATVDLEFHHVVDAGLAALASKQRLARVVNEPGSCFALALAATFDAPRESGHDRGVVAFAVDVGGILFCAFEDRRE